MKDSGVQWLGDVPAHWEVPPGRRCFKEIQRPNTGLVEKTVLSLSYGRIVVKPEEKLHGLVPASFETYQIVEPGEIICRPTDLQNDKTSLRFGYSGNRGIITSAYIALQTQEGIESSYGYLLLHAYDLKKIFYGLGSGLRQNLDWKDFKKLPCLVPPPDEQTAIVRFLDYADRRIRRYIRAKQKLIKLLEEQKQATIHRAVTRGLDPNVRLKPSGVEWLGEVPEHWKLKRFKFLGKITSGQVDPREPQHKEKILIAPNHIKSGTGIISHLETAEDQGADSGKYVVLQGQIIYSKIRPNLRKAVIAPMDCLCSADMYPITVRKSELRTEYLLQLLLSLPFTRYAVDCSLRVAMPKVNREALGECWLWYPSLEEQDRIVASIKQSVDPSNTAIAQAEQEIALLREYQTRLIAYVVTGKLDVREAAAQLPQEDETPATLDTLIDEADSEEESDELEALED